jgi:predicted DNA-binding transcriptional regulator AlpA
MGQPDDRRVRLKDLLNAGQVADELGITVSSVYVYRRRQRDGTPGYQNFPQPVLEHGRCLMWHRGDIQRWMRGRGKKG